MRLSYDFVSVRLVNCIVRCDTGVSGSPVGACRRCQSNLAAVQEDLPAATGFIAVGLP